MVGSWLKRKKEKSKSVAMGVSCAGSSANYTVHASVSSTLHSSLLTRVKKRKKLVRESRLIFIYKKKKKTRKIERGSNEQRADAQYWALS